MSDTDALLFSAIEPFRTGLLPVSDGQTLYWEECGKPDGAPILFLHGGPGGPSRPLHRRFFNPGYWRFITFHQRGCGRSTPLAQTRGNTTQALIADIEALRRHLRVERWSVVGGSWGTALALAYGQAHPEPCRGFFLIGVTLCRDEDRAWWRDGTRKLYPEAFDALLDALPPAGRAQPMYALHALLRDPEPAVHLPAASAIALFSAATVGGGPSDPETLAAYEDPAVTLPLARLFVHYSVNAHFLGPDQLLHDLPRIVDKPCAILNGRRDVTTPVEAGWRLHRAWPGSSFTVLADAAHSLRHPAMARATLDLLDTMKSWHA